MSAIQKRKNITVVVVGILGALCMMAIPVCASADDSVTPLFYKANMLYEQKNYDAAIDTYLKIMATGRESGNVYFNIGNCYVKKGSVGRAVLYYERARRLMPRDSDLAANAAYARSMMKETMTDEGAVPLLRRTGRLFSFLTINEHTIAMAMLLVTCVLLVVLWRLGVLGRRWAPVLIGSVLVIGVVGGVGLVERIRGLGREAIVIAHESQVKFEPFEHATVHFTVFEGMSVMVLQSRSGWNKIERTDGKSGWLPSADVEKI